MPYIPNARMDRVKNPEDVFTLKYFAELLNSLELDEVEVLDPHSSVSEALINNLVVRTPKDCINRALNEIGVDCYVEQNPIDFDRPRKKYSLTMFYPDAGSMRRYSGMIALPYAFGIKKRDWETGQILGLDVAGEVDAIRSRDILIVDDICSRGGTFLHSAKKLKELGARDIYLYVSHCENTILEGELLTSGLIKRVFTTDSIFTKSHELIEVFKGVISK
jgi:ribose-phosphate pyrophosphokinase